MSRARVVLPARTMAKIRDLAREGHGYYAIANRAGLNHNVVRRVLREMDARITRSPSEDEIREAHRRYQVGDEGSAEIAASIRLSPQRMLARFHNLGLVVRPSTALPVDPKQDEATAQRDMREHSEREVAALDDRKRARLAEDAWAIERLGFRVDLERARVIRPHERQPGE